MTSLLPASTASRLGVVGLVLAAAGFGVIAGRTHAWNQSVGGLTAALGGGLVLFGVVIGIVILTVTALVLARLVTPRPVPKLRIAGLILVAVAAGFAGGLATAATTGGTYRTPVVLQAGGSARIAITTPGIDFVANAAPGATCHSVPDGTAVEMISTLDLGELTVETASGTLRADISVPRDEAGVAMVSLWIDGGDLPEGSLQPFWNGTAAVGQAGATTGTITFTGLLGTEKVDPSLTVGPWPATLAASLEWSCNGW